MKKQILSLLLISLSLVLLSCAKDALPPALFTGWVIGWTNDAAYVPTVKILKTGNGGASWTLQTLPAGCVGFYGNDISAVNGRVAWAAAGDRYYLDGGILHTADGGITWRQEQLPDIDGSPGPLSITAFDSQVAWAAVNQSGNLWWTSNGWFSWNKSNDAVGNIADLDDICASGTNVLWIAQNRGSGGGQAARITVTNGSFESNSYTNGNYNMEGISAKNDDQTAWLVGQRSLFGDPALPYGAIYFTNNGGVTWHLQTLPDNARDVDFWKVSFVGARR